MGFVKHTGMPPRTEPMARTPIRRFKVVTREGAPVVVFPQRKAPADTGPGKVTRRLVLERDGYQCVRCGRPAGPGIGIYSIQHRVARGVGGGNSPANLIVLCGTATTLCHGEVEAKRDPHDLEAGYRLESSQDPGAEAVMLASEHGSGVTKYLTEAGTYSDYPPGGDAA
jgi:hypothetical protein